MREARGVFNEEARIKRRRFATDGGECGRERTPTSVEGQAVESRGNVQVAVRRAALNVLD